MFIFCRDNLPNTQVRIFSLLTSCYHLRELHTWRVITFNWTPFVSCSNSWLLISLIQISTWSTSHYKDGLPRLRSPTIETRRSLSYLAESHRWHHMWLFSSLTPPQKVCFHIYMCIYIYIYNHNLLSHVILLLYMNRTFNYTSIS